MDTYGIISLLPVAIVVILAFFTKRTFEPLLAGSIVGFIILNGSGFFTPWIDAIYTVMMDGVTVWIILVCGLFGSLVALLEKSGGAIGFSSIAIKIARNRGSSLIVTWILGIIIFIDDYLNALAVGTAMRKVTDEYKVPREFLAYVINSTGAAVCVLIPFSTWSAFMAGQLEANGVLVDGSATAAYIHTIPYMFYAIVAVLVVPLFALKIIPTFGPMKKAISRAEESNQLFPNNMNKEEIENELLKEGNNNNIKANALNFIIPMIALAAVTIYTSDMLQGVIISIVVCAILFFPQKIMSTNDFFDSIISGFKDMILVLGIIIAAFILQQANDALGLTPYIIEIVEKGLSPALLPAVTFLIIAFLAFATGSFWGIAAIAFPIIIPLAQSMDVNVFLVCGAIVSAATFGSHTCFYGDAVTLSCASSQIHNIDYAKTSLPLIALPTLLGLALFLAFGFMA